jgi:hypothetical protein
MDVLPVGVPTIHITPNTGDLICQGTSVSFVPATTFGGASPDFIWMVNGTIVGSGSSYTYAPLIHDVVNCIAVSNYLCKLADSAYSNNVDMEVTPAVAPVVSISADPGTTVSDAQTITLTASVVNGGPNPAYQWLVNGSAVAGANSATFTRSTFANKDSVTCRVLSSGICQDIEGSKSVIIHFSHVGVKQVGASDNEITLIPNPNKGAFKINCSFASSVDQEAYLTITNMVGQAIYSNTLMTHDGKIEEQVYLNNSLPSGIYLLTVRSAGENRIVRFEID